MPSGIGSDRMAEGAFPFAIRQRVRFAETDAQGVVYYANYLMYAEVGRVAFLRHLGLDYADLRTQDVDFTIGEARVRYHAPLRFDDEYDIRVRVGEIRRASWAFDYRIDRADGLCCADVTTTQVMLNRGTFKAVAIRDDILAKLRGAA
jgi:acyl-CoA thioester hydrolase